MSLPTNRVKKVTASNGTVYDIVPEMLQKSGYSAELPTLTSNSTISLTNVAQTISGEKTFSKPVYINNSGDAQGTSDTTNTAPLVIGPKTGAHLELDGNELMAKATASTVGTLYINNNGGVTSFGDSIMPGASGKHLGSSGQRWSDLQMTGFLSKGATGSGTCSTAATTAAKTVTIANFGTNISSLASGNVFVIYVSNANTVQSALTLNINSLGAKPIYINNAASSSTNYTLSKGWHTFYYNGTNFYTQDYAISGFDAGHSMKSGFQIPVANGSWDLGISPYRWRNLFLTGQMNTSSTTDSSSTANGSIVTKGGIGVAKNIHCGASIYGTTIYENGTSLASKYVTVNGANMSTTLWKQPTRNHTGITDYAGVGYSKYGKLVRLHIGDMLCTSDINSAGGDLKLFSGLPKPNLPYSFPCEAMPSAGWAEHHDVIRLWLNTDGCLYLHYSVMFPNNQYGGDLVYIEA